MRRLRRADIRCSSPPRRPSDKDNVWSLRNGVLHKLGPDGFVQYEVHFPEMQLNLKRAVQDMWESQQTPEEMGLRDLRQRINAFSGVGQCRSAS